MEKIVSKDGTPIAYYKGGSGSPLVLVHGTGSMHTRWTPILPALEKYFTVYAVDRRGRGESGDAPGVYAMDREFGDVAAVVDAIGGPVDLFGHSYGAICSLEAALLTSNIRRLVLYEPPLPAEGVQIYAEGLIDRLHALLDAGDREGLLTAFMTEAVRMLPHEIELTKSMPAWPSRVATAHTLPRELRSHEAYRFRPHRFRDLSVPVLLLVGGDSPEFFKTAVDLLAATLPEARKVVMPGQQHIAMESAPDLLTHEVVSFLKQNAG